MPDHFRALVVGLTETSDLKEFVRIYKQKTNHWAARTATSERFVANQFSNDRILREADLNDAVIRYILMNPVRAHRR